MVYTQRAALPNGLMVAECRAEIIVLVKAICHMEVQKNAAGAERLSTKFSLNLSRYLDKMDSCESGDGTQRPPSKSAVLAARLFKQLYDELDWTVDYIVEKFTDLLSAKFEALDVHPEFLTSHIQRIHSPKLEHDTVDVDVNEVLGEAEIRLLYYSTRQCRNQHSDRGLSFFAKCAVASLLNDDDSGIFELVHEHILKAQIAICDGTRARCCQLIGLMLDELESKEEEFEPMEDADGDRTERWKNEMIRVLVKRACDKASSSLLEFQSAFVRVEVIRAFSMLDSVDCTTAHGPRAFDPDKWIKKELRDVSRDVRAEAVRAVWLRSSEDIDHLLDVLLSEQEVVVRRLIFGRITRSINVADLSITQRMQIIKIGLNDEDRIVRMIVCDRLLPLWAGGDGALPFALLKHLEYIKEGDLCFQVRMQCLVSLFLIFWYPGKLLESGGSNEKGLCTSGLYLMKRPAREQILCALLSGVQIVVLVLSVHVLGQAVAVYLHYFQKTHGCVTMEELVTVMRRKADEAIQNGKEGGVIDARNCSDIFENFLRSWSYPADTVEGLNEEFIFLQLCFIARTYDLTDSYTMNAWKCLLEMFVSVRCMPNSARAIEVALNDIFWMGYASHCKVEEYVEWCCYRMNSFMTRNLNDTEVQPLALGLIGAKDANCTQTIRASRATDRTIEDSYDDMEEGYKVALCCLPIRFDDVHNFGPHTHPAFLFLLAWTFFYAERILHLFLKCFYCIPSF
ncbi:unnamed protein product [Toxocara canis]|uniref:Cnd3 domain-containing protein n=1 Tax=Toxocara canis TaxID=6265 RepID=A0A183UUP3_TOXCA|nr:unnamed protein product [Toxocara canis]